MKKFASTFIIALFIGLNCFCINPNGSYANNRLLDSVIVYNFSGVDSVKFEKLEYFYNDEGDNTLLFKYLWDSVLNGWSLYVKNEIQYNATGNKTLEIAFQVLSGTDELVKYRKTEYEYDDAGNQTTIASYAWLRADNVWRGAIKETKSFDKAGNEILYIEYAWSTGTLDWYERYKIYREFDQFGNMTLDAKYERNTQTRELQLISLMEYQYNENGDYIQSSQYSAPLSGQNNSFTQIRNKHEYTYNENGNIIQETNYSWYSDTKVWNKSQKIEYQYDEHGRIILMYRYYKDPNNNNLNLYRKQEYEYNASGKLIRRIVFSWSDDLQVWLIANNYTYEYDSNGNQILFDEGGTKYVREYDYAGNLTLEEYYNGWHRPQGSSTTYPSGIHKFEKSYDEFGNLTHQVDYEYNSDKHDWDIKKKTTYYFSDYILSTESISESKLKLYPNPTAGVLNFSGILSPADVKIYNINGQLVKSFQQVNSSIDISELKTGVYIIRINSKDEICVHKVVKK